MLGRELGWRFSTQILPEFTTVLILNIWSVVAANRQTKLSRLHSDIKYFQVWSDFYIILLPIQTGAVVLFIVFSVFQKLPPTGLRLEESTRYEVIITPVYLPGFFRSWSVWKYKRLPRSLLISQTSPLEVRDEVRGSSCCWRQLCQAIKTQIMAPKASYYWGYFLPFAVSLWHKRAVVSKMLWTSNFISDQAAQSTYEGWAQRTWVCRPTVSVSARACQC